MTCYVQDGTLNVTHSHRDLWLTCDHFVGKASHYGSTNQINSAFDPLGVGKFVVIHITTLNSGVETIRRQAGAAYGCLVADSKHPRALPTAYRLYASSVWSCHLWCYRKVMP